MDPDTALAEARRHADVILNTPERDRAATDLAESFHVLDEWLAKGGFLPYEWRVHRSGSLEEPS